VNLVVYSQDEWLEASEVIHSLVFEKFRNKELSRIDFVIFIWNSGVPVGYMTCREFDSESIYIGYGGIFPEFRGTEVGYSALLMAIDYLKSRYQRASMLIENNNYKMMKLAMKLDFKITGIRNAGEIFLEHSIEWGK
jgi:RimJ/RimL family protein N-acetyltransferase